MSGASISPEEFASYGLDYDDIQLGWIRSVSDRTDAAVAEAARNDNEHLFPTLHRSKRWREFLAGVMGAVHANDWHFVMDEQGRHWVWSLADGETHYTIPALNGAMLGINASRMVNDSQYDDFIYALRSGAVPRWLGCIKEQSCAVKKCWHGMPNPPASPAVMNVIVSARGGWLIATTCCANCIEWLGISGS